MKTENDHKGSLPAKVTNLETGEVTIYPSLKTAGEALGVHKSTVHRAINSKKPINGMMCSYAVLESVEDQETWIWNLNWKLYDKYPNVAEAAKAIGATIQGVSRAITTGGKVQKGYRATNGPREVIVKERRSKVFYVAYKIKWEQLGRFKNFKKAAAETGLSESVIKRFCKTGFIYQETYRGTVWKNGKVIVEKVAYEKEGEFPRLTVLEKISGHSRSAISLSIKRGGNCGGDWKFEKKQKSASGGKSNATLESILP